MNASFSVALPLLVLCGTLAGIVLITLGVRGRPVFTLPRCGRCGYDLRNVRFMSEEIGKCPECGAPLDSSDGVSFGRWQRRPRQVVLGFALLALPWLVMLPLAFFASRSAAVTGGPAGMAQQATPALVASLPANMAAPWAWQELEQRLAGGRLATTDVDAAFAALAAHFNAERAAGKPRQPAHWFGPFIEKAINGNAASAAAVDALCRAYYGQGAPVTMRGVARAAEPILVALGGDHGWNIDGMQYCWAITGITAENGAAVSVHPRHSPRDVVPLDSLSGTGSHGAQHLSLTHALSPGEHELSFACEFGVVPSNVTFVGLDGRPGTPDKWPAPVSRWKATLKRKLTVVAPGESLVAVVTDPERDPFASGPVLSIEDALARPSSRGAEVVLKWKVVGDPSPILAYRVSLRAGEKTFDYGTLLAGRTATGSVTSYTSGAIVTALPPDVRQIDLVLTPDSKVAETHVEIEEIWGRPQEVNGVTLRRFDLSTAGADEPVEADRATTRPTAAAAVGTKARHSPTSTSSGSPPHSAKPYQVEWNVLIDAIVNDKAYDETKRGVEASVATSMGAWPRTRARRSPTSRCSTATTSSHRTWTRWTRIPPHR